MSTLCKELPPNVMPINMSALQPSSLALQDTQFLDTSWSVPIGIGSAAAAAAAYAGKPVAGNTAGAPLPEMQPCQAPPAVCCTQFLLIVLAQAFLYYLQPSSCRTRPMRHS